VSVVQEQLTVQGPSQLWWWWQRWSLKSQWFFNQLTWLMTQEDFINLKLSFFMHYCILKEGKTVTVVISKHKPVLL